MSNILNDPDNPFHAKAQRLADMMGLDMNDFSPETIDIANQVTQRKLEIQARIADGEWVPILEDAIGPKDFHDGIVHNEMTVAGQLHRDGIPHNMAVELNVLEEAVTTFCLELGIPATKGFVDKVFYNLSEGAMAETFVFMKESKEVLDLEVPDDLSTLNEGDTGGQDQ